MLAPVFRGELQDFDDVETLKIKGVERVVPILAPYKMASSEVKTPRLLRCLRATAIRAS